MEARKYVAAMIISSTNLPFSVILCSVILPIFLFSLTLSSFQISSSSNYCGLLIFGQCLQGSCIKVIIVWSDIMIHILYLCF